MKHPYRVETSLTTYPTFNEAERVAQSIALSLQGNVAIYEHGRRVADVCPTFCTPGCGSFPNDPTMTLEV